MTAVVLLLALLVVHCADSTDTSNGWPTPETMDDVAFGVYVPPYTQRVLEALARGGASDHPLQGIYRAQQEMTTLRGGKVVSVSAEIRLVVGPDGKAFWGKFLPNSAGRLQPGERLPGRWVSTTVDVPGSGDPQGRGQASPAVRVLIGGPPIKVLITGDSARAEITNQVIGPSGLSPQVEEVHLTRVR